MFTSKLFYRRFVVFLVFLILVVTLLKGFHHGSSTSPVDSSNYEECHSISSLWSRFFSADKPEEDHKGFNSATEKDMMADPTAPTIDNTSDKEKPTSEAEDFKLPLLKAKKINGSSPPTSPLVMVDQGMQDFKAKVGRATWTLFHSIAARYAENPTEEQQQNLRDLFKIIPKVYPCDECARDMTGLLQQDPPQVTIYFAMSAI